MSFFNTKTSWYHSLWSSWTIGAWDWKYCTTFWPMTLQYALIRILEKFVLFWIICSIYDISFNFLNIFWIFFWPMPLQCALIRILDILVLFFGYNCYIFGYIFYICGCIFYILTDAISVYFDQQILYILGSSFQVFQHPGL